MARFPRKHNLQCHELRAAAEFHAADKDLEMIAIAAGHYTSPLYAREVEPIKETIAKARGELAHQFCSLWMQWHGGSDSQ
jgi:hypothetical protein